MNTTPEQLDDEMIIQALLDTIERLREGGEYSRPYQFALEYLVGHRDPWLLDTLQPDMRIAVKLVLGGPDL